MTGLLLVLSVAVVGLGLAVIWLASRLASPPVIDEALRQVPQRVADLLAQLGRESAFQQNLRQALVDARMAVAELQRLKGERQADLQAFSSKLATVEGELRKVSGVLAGRGSGGAGENILREALRLFPHEWVRSPFQIGGKDVEFGLVLFDKRVVPIDSKFAATELLEQLERLGDDGEKGRLLRQIEDRVLRQAAEIGKYLDPSITTPFAICAVPDSVYRVLRGAHTRAYQDYRVIVMSYSTTIPVLLALYQLHLKYLGNLDEARLDACLSAIEAHVGMIRRNMENRVKDAQVQLGNAYQECLQAVGAIEGSVASLKAGRLTPVADDAETEVVG